MAQRLPEMLNGPVVLVEHCRIMLRVVRRGPQPQDARTVHPLHPEEAVLDMDLVAQLRDPSEPVRYQARHGLVLAALGNVDPGAVEQLIRSPSRVERDRLPVMSESDAR